MTQEEAEQYARGFLMFLLGITLFADWANTVPLCLLSALVDVTRIRLYDWGGEGLDTLYGYMSSSSRCSGQLLGGYWRAWEVYFLFCFTFLLFIICTLYTTHTVVYFTLTVHCTHYKHAICFTLTIYYTYCTHCTIHGSAIFALFCILLYLHSALSDKHTDTCSVTLCSCGCMPTSQGLP